MSFREEKLNKELLNPKSIPKFTEELPINVVFKPEKVMDNNKNLCHKYNISMRKVQVQMLPKGFPKTLVFAYGGIINTGDNCKKITYYSVPGGTIEAVKGIPVYVNWINELRGNHILPVDPTIHWPNPNKMPKDLPKPYPPFPPGFPLAQSPIPTVTHLHGGEVEAIYDGHPDAWITCNGIKGKKYKDVTHKYLNEQPTNILWYHDHTMGITRLNVYAGLAGLYIIRDFKNPLDNYNTTPFPKGKYEITLMIQDKSFYKDGSLFYQNVGNNPEIHPYWSSPLFHGVNVVNGKVWPNLNVEKRAYRFKILNGANERFYRLKLSNNKPFIQIGGDGGYLVKPVILNEILISPGERIDIIIDFSNTPLNTKIVLENTSPALFQRTPYPDKDTDGQIMQFTIKWNAKGDVKPLKIPDTLNVLPKLKVNSPKKIIVLSVNLIDNNPTKATTLLLNGQSFHSPVSEISIVGATEIWEFVNLMSAAHSIHIHLVNFQILNRQGFDAEAYKKDWLKLNENPPLEKPTKTLNPDRYLKGPIIPPEFNELSWKDTANVYAYEVLRVLVRISPVDADPLKVKPGVNTFPFDPTKDPGYVHHCHMLEHEDNDMMRPFIVVDV